MIDSLAKLLAANGLNPDSFTASDNDERIFCGEIPPGHILQTWLKLTQGAPETKYWPIIRGGTDEYRDHYSESDPESILAAAPVGNIREILQPRFEERRHDVAEFMPGAAEATDMDHLARLVDFSGINSFSGGNEDIIRPWPTE